MGRRCIKAGWCRMYILDLLQVHFLAEVEIPAPVKVKEGVLSVVFRVLAGGSAVLSFIMKPSPSRP